jgi:hypothetical protein
MSLYKPYNQALSSVGFELLNIEEGESKNWQSSEFEAVFVLIQGESTIACGNKKESLKRQNVFDDKPSAVFVSPNNEVLINAISPTIFAVCKARATENFECQFILPDMLSRKHRGKDRYNRDIIDIVNTNIETQCIAVGETINEPGEWSSFICAGTVYLLGTLDSLEVELAHQAARIAAKSSKLLREQTNFSYLRGQGLHTRGEINRRSQYREIQSGRRTNVPVEYLAKMQTAPETNRKVRLPGIICGN